MKTVMKGRSGPVIHHSLDGPQKQIRDSN